MIILIFVAFCVIAALQIPFIVRNKQKKELVFYIIFLFIGLMMTLFYSSGIQLANPVKGIRYLLDVMNIHY